MNDSVAPKLEENMDPNTRILCRCTSLVLRKHEENPVRNWEPVSDEGGVPFDVKSGVDQIAQSSLHSAGGVSVTPTWHRGV